MLRWLWVTIFIIFSDQLTKWMAEASLEDVGVPYAIVSHLNMTLSYNTGAAFSFLANQGGWQRWFFAILAIAVCLFILQWMRKLKEDETWTAIGLALVLGGAVGNLVDRVLYGKVIDFIDVYWTELGYHFATFNVADIAISLGAALLVIISLFTKDEDAKKA